MDNHGKPWTMAQEYRVLKLYVERRASLNDIADHMGRQREAIIARFVKMGLAQREDPHPGEYSGPLRIRSRSSPQVVDLLNEYERQLGSNHRRGPNDPSGWEDEGGAEPVEEVNRPDQEQDTMKNEFFETKHYIAGMEVSGLSDEELIAAIQKEAAYIAKLETVKPMPKRIEAMLLTRKLKLQQAVDFLDSIDFSSRESGDE